MKNSGKNRILEPCSVCGRLLKFNYSATPLVVVSVERRKYRGAIKVIEHKVRVCKECR